MAGFKIDFSEGFSDEVIFEELRSLAALVGNKTVSRVHVEAASRVSYDTIVKRFGSLQRALQLAGVEANPYREASDETLLDLLVALWVRILEKEGRTPHGRDLATFDIPVTGDFIAERFGSWQTALMRAHASVQRDSLEPDGGDSPDAADGLEVLPVKNRFFIMKRDEFACSHCGSAGFGVRLGVYPLRADAADVEDWRTLCTECWHDYDQEAE